MPSRYWSLKLKLICALLLMAANALCAIAQSSEVKILDAKGLVRAIRRANSPVTVIVAIKESLSSDKFPSLTNLDGVAPDIIAASGTSSEIVFHSVNAGVWQLKSHGESPEVTMVKITE